MRSQPCTRSAADPTSRSRTPPELSSCSRPTHAAIRIDTAGDSVSIQPERGPIEHTSGACTVYPKSDDALPFFTTFSSTRDSLMRIGADRLAGRTSVRTPRIERSQFCVSRPWRGGCEHGASLHREAITPWCQFDTSEGDDSQARERSLRESSCPRQATADGPRRPHPRHVTSRLRCAGSAHARAPLSGFVPRLQRQVGATRPRRAQPARAEL